MSWNVTGTATARRKSGGDGIGVHIEFPNPCPQNGPGAEESNKAIVVAQEAVRALLESGAFGTGVFNVQTSGHSNPGNEPSRGYVNDNVQISIQQKNDPEA